MKTKTMVAGLGMALLTFQAKAQSGHAGHEMKPGTTQAANQKTDPVFQTQLTKVYQASLNLKDALVAADAAEVKSAVAPVKQALAKVDMQLLKGKAHTDWMTYRKALNGGLDQIQGNGTVEKQRVHFARFSEALYRSLKTYGIKGQTAYYQFCPMAINQEGAYWLSDTKEIKNPYFGNQMLHCGETKETLQ